jgi:chromosome segregation ATPase
MRIRSIRLREVGPFVDGIAVEGLSPGLNLLAGPNEHGKSTLFRALRTLFTQAYSANNKLLRELRPHSGGAPLIVCDFELNGVAWVLSKQYIAAPRAELREVTGKQIYRGGDVEPALGELLAKARVPLSAANTLWIGQGDAFKQPEFDPAMRTSLGELVRREAEIVSGGAQLVAVHEQIQRALEALVTKAGRKPKKGGPYHQAIAKWEEARDALETARGREAASHERRQRLEAIETERGALEAPEARKSRQHAQERLAAQVEEAEQARAQVALLDERIRHLQATEATAVAQLQDYDRSIAALATTQHELEALAHRESILTAELPALQERAQHLSQRHAERLATRERMQNARLAAERRSRHADLTKHAAALQQRLAKSKSLQARQANDAAAIAAIKVDERQLHDIRRLEGDLNTATARLEAAAPRLHVRYESADAPPVTINGQPLSDGQIVTAEGPTILSLPGIGELHVQPARATDGADPLAERNRLQESFATALQAAGADNLQAAESALARKRQLLADDAGNTALLASLAPEGIEHLEADAARIGDELAALADAVAADPQEPFSTATWDELLAALAQGEAELGQNHQLMANHRVELAKLTTEREGLGARLRDFAERLPGASEQRRLRREELAGAVSAAQQNLNETLRTRSAWQEKAPDDEAFALLRGKLEEHTRAEASAAQRIAALREEARAIQGALDRDLEDGVAADTLMHQERCEAAQRDMLDVQRDIAALTVLEKEVGAARQLRGTAIAKPLAERIAALARDVLPVEQLQLNEDLTVAGLERDATAEALDTLSDGTREQISILSRLALAQALAEDGQHIPIMLDDPLVFSDDSRLDAMFRRIAEAARHSQVIALTCHARSFEPLVELFGAKRLALTPWSPSE